MHNWLPQRHIAQLVATRSLTGKISTIRHVQGSILGSILEASWARLELRRLRLLQHTTSLELVQIIR